MSTLAQLVPQLTHLNLSHNKIKQRGLQMPVRALSKLTALQDLQLIDVYDLHEVGSCLGEAQLQPAWESALLPLTALTRLQMHVGLSKAAMEVVSAATQLQDLDLAHPQQHAPPALSSLTKLNLRDCIDKRTINGGSFAHLSVCTHLRWLDITQASFQNAMPITALPAFASLTQLEHLAVCGFTAKITYQVQEAAHLTSISMLTRLTNLSVGNPHGTLLPPWGFSADPVNVLRPAIKALTNLQELRITDYGQPAMLGAWRQPWLPLTKLTALQCSLIS